MATEPVGHSEAGTLHRLFGAKDVSAHLNVSETEKIGANATKTLSGIRILFGSVFLFDGILKWLIIQQGLLQGTVLASDAFGVPLVDNNWFAFGLMIALGETFGGIALILGLFQRPAAIWSSAIMFAIWAFGGYGGAYAGGVWSFTGYTDPGGDLMLAFVFVGLVFSPYAYSLASRFRLRERWPGSSFGPKLKRFLVT